MKEFELEPGEHVVIETRKHWFLFVIQLLPYAILAILSLALPKLLAFAPPLVPYLNALEGHKAILRALLGVWLLIVWTIAWSSFTKYYLCVWVVTNQRIVDIKQKGYFNRRVSSLFLTRVQDVTTDVRGVLTSLLDIGKITVQSAGTVDEFHMPGIPYPERMRDIILKYVALERNSKNDE